MKKVSVAIVEHEHRFLVVRRRQKEGNLAWAFPAGGVEAGEDDQKAAVRETLEETGVQSQVVRPFGERVHPDTGTTLSYWLCRSLGGEARVADAEEIAEVRWVTGKEALSLFTSDIFALVKKYLLGQTS